MQDGIEAFVLGVFIGLKRRVAIGRGDLAAAAVSMNERWSLEGTQAWVPGTPQATNPSSTRHAPMQRARGNGRVHLAMAGQVPLNRSANITIHAAMLVVTRGRKPLPLI